MNDEELTPSEHREMREVVLAGTQRIRPAGAHRAQLIAAAVALVLVGGITGGAITTAALLGDATTGPISTPTGTDEGRPSPSPSATPSPSAPAAPAEGIVAFGGECENVTTDAATAAVTGMPMALSDYRWQTGAESVLGGIDCLWLSSESYAAASASVFAYPAASVPASIRDAVVPGCRVVDVSADQSECTATGVVDGTWLLVQTVGDSAGGTETAIAALFADVAARSAAFTPPVPAERTAEWWTMPDCAQLVGRIDPAVFGYERVESSNPTGEGLYATSPREIPTAAGVRTTCGLFFSSGTGDSVGGKTVSIAVVAGGAVDFEMAVAAEHAQPVSVPGASSAVWVPGNDRYEGSWEVLLSTDGVNTLVLYADGPDTPETYVPLAGELLSVLAG